MAQLISSLMECVAAILIRSTAITHKHYLNDPPYKHMISSLLLLMTCDRYTQKRKEQFPESDAGNAPIRSEFCLPELFFSFFFQHLWLWIILYLFHLTEHPVTMFCSLSILDLVYCYREQTGYFRDAQYCMFPPLTLCSHLQVSYQWPLSSPSASKRSGILLAKLCANEVLCLCVLGLENHGDLIPNNASP